MLRQIPTIRVVNEDSRLGYRIIREADYDPDVHEKWYDKPASDVNATSGAADLASEEGVDLADVTGTGKDGRITKGDVEDFLAAADE